MIYTGKKYHLTDTQVKKIARLCVQENGEAACAAEASLMANLFELQSKYLDLYDYVRNGGWFYRAAHYMDTGSCSSSAIAKVKDVLVNGNRTLPAYVNEHDCFSDIKSVTNNGKSVTKTDRSKYKKDVTVIKNRYGSTYTFYCFPAEGSDPFGYTAEAYKKIGGQAKTLENAKAGTNSATTTIADKLIAVAEAEVGYLEKKSNSQLDSKTGNAGSGNYVKYWRDMDKSLQGEAWCGCFVNWCFFKAYGKDTAKKLTCGGLYDFYTPDMAQYYKDAGQWHTKPKKGDVIFFKNSERIYHTGIVYKVTGSTVYTIEGNTSSGSQVIANGGAVCKKSYSMSLERIAGYGRPIYGGVKLETGSKKDTATPMGLKEEAAWTGTVTASSLRVRAWAGTENDECSFSPLKKGTKVGVCSAIRDGFGDLWYYILYKNKHGFVHSDYII